MRYWLPYMFEDTSQLLEVARAAERFGFEGIALADHVAVPKGFASVHPSGENPFDERSSFPEPFTCIAAMATVTTTLRFLPYVYIAPMREPFSVAKTVGTAAALTNHRLALGVGAGWLREEFILLGHDPSTRGRRLDEMIEVVRRFWRDGTAEFHGEFFDFGPTGMYPVPGGPIPIWVGGKSDIALERAVHNDGWLGMNYDLDEIDRLLSRLSEKRDRAGDPGRPFETMVVANAIPTPSLMDDLGGAGRHVDDRHSLAAGGPGRSRRSTAKRRCHRGLLGPVHPPYLKPANVSTAGDLRTTKPADGAPVREVTDSSAHVLERDDTIDDRVDTGPRR